MTGQHPGLELADHDLDGLAATPLGCPGQPDPQLHADLVRAALKRLLQLAPPELLVVQGDTSSALGGALAARDCGILLAHVEAGLRSHDVRHPWPEEGNRVAIDRISDLLFAPTEGNASNLRSEAVGGDVFVTGNSGIDALAAIAGPLPSGQRWRWLPRREFRLLVTCHRRENWGEGLGHLAAALAALGDDGVISEVVLPPNPTVTATMVQLMGEDEGFEYMKALHKNVNQYTKSGSAPIKAAGLGETAVGIVFMHDAVAQTAAGFPIVTVAPCEGTGYEIGSMSLIKGARNPDQAKKFYDWALTADMQNKAKDVKSFQLPSNKNATPSPLSPDLSTIKLIDYDFKKYGSSDERKRLLQKWDTEVSSLPQ